MTTSNQSDSQAEDELRTKIINLMADYGVGVHNGNPSDFVTELEAYAERLTTRRAIAELSTIPGIRTNHTDYLVEQSYLKDRITTLTAELKEGK